jgi:PleD family two-component response regulator
MELNTRLMYANGKPGGIQGIARDIRIRKKLADQLKQRNKELEKANATIRSLMNQDSLTKLPNRRSLKNALE